MIKSFTPREQRIAMLLIAAIGLFGYDRWIITPLFHAQRDCEVEIRRMQKQNLLNQEALDHRLAIEEAFRKLPKEKTDQGSQNNRLLGEVSSLARATGIKILDMRPLAEQEVLSRSSAASVTVEASWSSLVHFIVEIQQSPSILSIDRSVCHAVGEQADLINGQFVIRLASQDSAYLSEKS